MKKLLILCIGIGVVMACSSAYAISISDGWTPSGIIGNNTHTHVTTKPGTLLYAVTIRATAANGFANIIDTQYRVNANSGSGGAGADWVSKDRTLADPQELTANVSKTIVFPDGIQCGGLLFIDTNNAECEVYYRN